MIKVCGIYKIKSPSGRVYIGQSIDVKNRFNKYNSLCCKKQFKLYNSLKKYGVNSHVFEVIFECEKENLNSKERYYQDLYNVIGPNGLNCVLTKSDLKFKVYSKETKEKMSISNTGKTHSKETIEKLRQSSKGNTNWKGKKHSEETKLKMSISRKNRFFLESTKIKMMNSMLGKNTKIILNTETGVFYNGTKEAAESININKHTLGSYLTNKNKNKTNLIYV